MFQIIQQSTNHFNELYKLFNMVQIIQRGTYHSMLYKSLKVIEIF